MKKLVIATIVAVIVSITVQPIAAIIATDTITARTIAAGAITTDKLFAGAVTADKISVGSLDAISADIGAIVAGSLTGVTAVFGSGSEVALDASGISLADGGSTASQLKWGDGSTLYAHTVSGFATIEVTSDVLNLNNTTTTIGSSNLVLGGFTGAGNDYLCINAGGAVFRSSAAC